MRAAGKIAYAGPGAENSHHPVETTALCHASSVAHGFAVLKRADETRRRPRRQGFEIRGFEGPRAESGRQGRMFVRGGRGLSISPVARRSPSGDPPRDPADWPPGYRFGRRPLPYSGGIHEKANPSRGGDAKPTSLQKGGRVAESGRRRRDGHAQQVRGGGKDGVGPFGAVLRLLGRGVPGPEAGGPLRAARRARGHRSRPRSHHGGAAGRTPSLRRLSVHRRFEVTGSLRDVPLACPRARGPRIQNLVPR